ncbi:MAG: putative bifunctional diguanylate cyclase/phosphodiesterase [Burkholderiaceae bacterium]
MSTSLSAPTLSASPPVSNAFAKTSAPPSTRQAPALPRGRLATRLALISAGALLTVHGGLAVLVYLLGGSHALPMLTALGASAVLSLCIVSGAVHLEGHRLGRRIARIISVLDAAHTGDYSKRISVRTQDDLGALASQVNELLSNSATRELRILESALSDPLTGLPNRTLLTERLRHMLALSRRRPAPFAIAVLDLDRFKFVNDTLGHAAGDAVLKEVARRLRKTVREGDTVARLGGDEFVLMLPGGEAAVREVASRIIDAMQEPLNFREQRIDIGLSIGIAMHPQHGADDLTLLRHADSAMYKAKRKRAGLEVFSGELNEVRRSYLSMLGELRRALEGDQLFLQYQPKLEVSSGMIVGLEGLVRWRHPTRGNVPPSEFVPFAEQSGFVREITQWVIGQGARFSHKLATEGLDICVAVNVSAQDIESSVFAQAITEIVRKEQPAPGRLCLEITESGLVSETANAVANLRAIAALGVRLAVDDFGTGYATLKQLQSLPVHELKVDRSFVSGMHENRGNQTIVRSTIDLGKQLGLRVVAEGVETVEELRGLAAMGCDEVQGYYVAKPMDPEESIDWVRMRNALQGAKHKRYSALSGAPA